MQNADKKNKRIFIGGISLLFTVLFALSVIQYKYNLIAYMQIPEGTIVVPIPGKPKPTQNSVQMQTFPFVTATPTPTPKPTCDTGASGKPVIVLDPGHSGTDVSTTDPATGLLDHDYPNFPEIQEMFDVATLVKRKLETDGYTVIMTKNAMNDTVSHRARANTANNAHAAIAVSIHNDHGQPNSFAQVFVQKVGLYRESGGKRVTFNNANVASKSQQYGQIIAQERTNTEGHAVKITDNSFNGRPGIAPGNLALVQLFSTVPWVYNEIGASNGFNKNKYALGIANGIEKAVPATGAQDDCTGGAAGGAGGTGGAGSALAQAVLKLAKAQIGKPYVWGSPSRNWASNPPQNAPGGFDCSGLVGWSYYWATNGKIKMNGQTSADFGGNNPAFQKFGPEAKAQLQPGDILYWAEGRIHHTALYEGAGNCGGPHCFVEAQQTGKPLMESNLDTHKDPLAGFLRPK